jgi:Cu(I)/Ag(I) efflux system membrane fusion protein
MHPEVVKNARGSCDVCGMDLVTADRLGYAKAPAGGEGPLVIPRTAVLLTGKRAIVYVEVKDAEDPTYEGREVVLGPRAGDMYVVESGLAEGERVVAEGNFKIDSALQIQARPSMMSPPSEGGTPAPPPAHHGGLPPAVPPAGVDASFRTSLAPIHDAYFALARALAADDAAGAAEAIRKLHPPLHAVKAGGLDAGARAEWQRLSAGLADALGGPAGSLDEQRATFEKISATVIGMRRAFGGADAHFITFCPMAFGGRGAEWLQDHATIDNPYFGSRMLRCGEIRETLAPAGGRGGR